MTQCLFGLGIILYGGLFTNLCMYLLYCNRNTKSRDRKYYKIYESPQNINAVAA